LLLDEDFVRSGDARSHPLLSERPYNQHCDTRRRLENGELLNAAEAAGFVVLLTTDKNMRYQQNLANRKIAIVVLGKPQWPEVRPHVHLVVAAVNAATPGTYVEVEIPEDK
jgi:hypothetical protein